MENNNRQGCRWVKPEDKLPKKEGTYYINEEPYRQFFDPLNESSKKYWIENVIEWLDESIEPCATSSENKNTNMNKSFSKFIGDNAVAEINGFALPGSEYVIRVIGSITDGDYLTDYIVQARPLGRDGETLHFRVSVFTDTIEPHNIQPLIKQ